METSRETNEPTFSSIAYICFHSLYLDSVGSGGDGTQRSAEEPHKLDLTSIGQRKFN